RHQRHRNHRPKPPPRRRPRPAPHRPRHPHRPTHPHRLAPRRRPRLVATPPLRPPIRLRRPHHHQIPPLLRHHGLPPPATHHLATHRRLPPTLGQRLSGPRDRRTRLPSHRLAL